MTTYRDGHKIKDEPVRTQIGILARNIHLIGDAHCEELAHVGTPTHTYV